MKIRNNLINKRKLSGYTQKSIATMFNITERHYQSLEAGTSFGSVKLWQQLSKLFDTTIDDLLEEVTDDEKILITR